LASEEQKPAQGRKKTTPKATAADAGKGSQVAKRRAPQAYYDACEEVAKGTMLAVELRKLGVTRHEFRHAMERDAELAAHYARARDDGFDAVAESLAAEADAPLPEGPDASSEVQRRRLAIDTKKWLLARWSGRYRDRVEGGASVSVTIATGVPEGGTASRRITVEATDSSATQRLELSDNDADG
jgi:hypothetical protein